MQVSTNPFGQFLLRQLSLAGTAVAERIEERQHFVQRGVAESRRRNALVQWLERDTSMRPFGMRPDRRKFGIGREMTAQRLRGMRRHDAAGHFSALRGEHVLQAEVVGSMSDRCWRGGYTDSLGQGCPSWRGDPADQVYRAAVRGDSGLRCVCVVLFSWPFFSPVSGAKALRRNHRPRRLGPVRLALRRLSRRARLGRSRGSLPHLALLGTRPRRLR
jgi:hypothetical protein